MPAPKVSLIVPTLNEAENLPVLVSRVDEALKDVAYEVLIVDDESRDHTEQACAELAKQFPLKLIVRTNPRDGLGGAVLEGMKQASGEIFVVMDADLQHPPEKLPELIAPLEQDRADFVIGSRYARGGTTEEHWGLFRRINSWVATLLARPFAGKVSDPMSGFFALKRRTYESAQRLTPLGYKIGLELMCKCRVQRVHEVPIHFAARQRGASKLTLKEQFRYLEHLSRLYDFTYPRASPIVKFLITLIVSWFVAFAAYLLVLASDARTVIAPIIAYPVAILVTAIFHMRYVRTQREFIVRKHPWWDFWFISLAEWVTCSLTALWLWSRVHDLGAIEFFVICFGAATVMRYILRKEFLQDVRGLRREARVEDIG